MTYRTNEGKSCFTDSGYKINGYNYRWRCPVSTCRKTRSLRDGSFFEKSKLSLQKWLHWWCREYPVTDASQEAKVTETTAIQAYHYFRDICSWRLLNHDSPLMLGGPGVEVQIDESQFKHKPKVYISSSLLTACIIIDNDYIIRSTTVAEDRPVTSGCLEWSTQATHQHWELWTL